MSGADNASRWYLVRTKRGKEVWAKREMEAVANEVFLPLLHSRSSDLKPCPLFPHRLFVRIDIERSRIDTKYTPGALGILFGDDALVEVPDEIIERLKALSQARATAETLPAGKDPLARELRAIFTVRVPSLEREVTLFRLIEACGGKSQGGSGSA